MDGEVRKEVLDFLEAMEMSFALIDDLESLKEEKEKEEARKKRNRDKIMGRLSELQESKKPS